jgi:hypothetical protein
VVSRDFLIPVSRHGRAPNECATGDWLTGVRIRRLAAVNVRRVRVQEHERLWASRFQLAWEDRAACRDNAMPPRPLGEAYRRSQPCVTPRTQRPSLPLGHRQRPLVLWFFFARYCAFDAAGVNRDTELGFELFG